MQAFFQSVSNRCWLLLLMFGLLLEGVGAKEGISSGNVGKDVKIPLRDQQGRLIALVSFAEGEHRSDKKLEIQKMVIQTFSKQESHGTLPVDWTFLSPNCIFNQESREAVSEADVRIFNKETEITGTGFHWLNESTRFIIRSAVQVLIAEGITKKEGAKPSLSTGVKSPTKIRSNLLTFDYEKKVDDHVERIALFEGNVMAEDPQLTLKCKEMDVHFTEKNNQVIRVVAKKEVRMYSESKVALSEKAVFTRETGTIVLSGGQPKLEDEKGNWILSRGDSIIYNIYSRRMDVNKPTVEFERSGNLVFASNSTNILGTTPSKGADSKTKPFTKIDSDLLNFDYEKHVAVFEGNVIAVDPQITLKCKTMKVFFTEKNNEVVRVEAYQNVQITGDGKQATAEKAVFTKETGIIVLTGGNPILKDAKGGWTTQGERIIYDMNTKRMQVEKQKGEIRHSGNSDLFPSLPAK